MGRIVAEHACLQEMAREAPPPPGCASKFAEARAATFVFGGRTREPSSRPPSPARRDVQCDEALEKGGLSAASEGVDDMDRGIGVAHRGQDAPLLLVYDFQRGRQVVQEAIVKIWGARRCGASGRSVLGPQQPKPRGPGHAATPPRFSAS